jgi:hypothetical protein
VTPQPSDHFVPGDALDDEVLDWIRAYLAADAALLRRLIMLFADRLMAADSDRLCRAEPDGSGERVDRRNGYRAWALDTLAGTVDLNVPRLRRSRYIPRWLVDAPDSAAETIEEAVCRAYVRGVTSDAVADLVVALGMVPLSPSRIAAVAATLHAAVGDERCRALRNGPYPELCLVAYTSAASSQRIRNSTTRIAIARDSHGDREVLGLAVTGTDDETGWRRLLLGLLERGLTGVAIVKSDVYTPGLVRAVRGELPGAACNGPVTAETPDSAPVPAEEATDDLARPAPVIVVRDHGRLRHDGPWSSNMPPPDGPSSVRTDKRHHRVAPILAGVAALVVAVALAAVWRNASPSAQPDEPLTPPTTAVVSPVATSALAPVAQIPVAAPAASPSTTVACVSPAGSFADLASTNPRVPWLEQVLCEAASTSGA